MILTVSCTNFYFLQDIVQMFFDEYIEYGPYCSDVTFKNGSYSIDLVRFEEKVR